MREEYLQYRDEGCEFARSCLNCPFPKCLFDEPGDKKRALKRQRDLEMVRLFNTEGKRVDELVLIFGVSKRTVKRALEINEL